MKTIKHKSLGIAFSSILENWLLKIKDFDGNF